MRTPRFSAMSSSRLPAARETARHASAGVSPNSSTSCRPNTSGWRSRSVIRIKDGRNLVLRGKCRLGAQRATSTANGRRPDGREMQREPPPSAPRRPAVSTAPATYRPELRRFLGRRPPAGRPAGARRRWPLRSPRPPVSMSTRPTPSVIRTPKVSRSSVASSAGSAAAARRAANAAGLPVGGAASSARARSPRAARRDPGQNSAGQPLPPTAPPSGGPGPRDVGHPVRDQEVVEELALPQPTPVEVLVGSEDHPDRKALERLPARVDRAIVARVGRVAVVG